MYADGHFDVANSASMFYVPVKAGDQITVTSAVGPGSAGTVTACISIRYETSDY